MFGSLPIADRRLDVANREAGNAMLRALPLIVLALVIVGISLIFEAARDPAPSPPVETEPQKSHRMMVEILQGLADETSEHHPYLGQSRARQLEQQLATLDPAATGRQRCELNFAIGQAKLKLGELRGAIQHLTRSYELLPAAGLDASTIDYVKFKLGVAWFRLGETENCCAAGGPEACIVPIGPAGVHQYVEGSTQAIRFFKEVLASKTTVKHARSAGASNSASSIDLHLAARWLLNLACMTLGGYPDRVPEEHRIPQSAFESSIEFPRFKNVAQGLGIDTFSLCGGAIVDDFDNDGYLDVVTSTWDTRGQLRLFRSNGDGTFTDRTEDAGLTGLFGGLNINQTDFDNDGNLDIFVMRGAWLGGAGQQPNSLIRNNGDGTFTDVTFLVGLGAKHYPTQTAAWADVDNDGDLDLYIGNEHSEALSAPCQLFINLGNGRFTDVADQAGVQNFAFTKGVALGDFDGDRFMDIYVSNYDAPNRLYRNNRDGTFTDVAVQLGVDKPITGFPTWFWDFDNDGVLDIFAASYTGRIGSMVSHFLGEPTKFESPCLYRGDGKGGFIDVAEQVGLRYPMLPMGANFGDLDNDGFLDLYLGTGDPDYETLMPNLMFLNRGGKKFIDVTMAGGFGHLQKGHGIAFADLDNDGDLDVFEQMGGAFAGDRFGDALFENPGFGNHWIGLQLIGQTSNRAAIGARIRIEITEDGKTRSIYRHVGSGGSFGASPLRQTIGLGKAARIDVLEIFWPTTGRVQTFRDLPVDQILQIVEDARSAGKLELKTFSLR